MRKNEGKLGKTKGPDAAAKGKRKAKLVAKVKCFHCNVDGH